MKGKAKMSVRFPEHPAGECETERKGRYMTSDMYHEYRRESCGMREREDKQKYTKQELLQIIVYTFIQNMLVF